MATQTQSIAARLDAWLDGLVRPFDGPRTAPPPSLWPFLRWALHDLRGAIVALAVLAMVVGASEAVIIAGVGVLVDRATASGVDAFWDQNGGFVFGLSVLVLVLRPLAMTAQSFVGSMLVGPNASSGTIWRLHRNSLRQSLRFFEDDFAGRLAQKEMQSGMSMAGLTIDVATSLGLVVSFFFATLAALAVVEPILTAPIIAWGVGYAALLRATLPGVRAAARERAERRAAATGVVVDSFTNMKTVKLFAHADAEEIAARDALEGYRSAMRVFGWRVSVLRMALAGLNGAATFASIAVALALWSTGAASIGALAAAAMLTVRLTAISNWIAFTLLGIFTEIGSIEDAIGTLAKEPDLVDRPSAAAAPSQRAPQIVFENVSFRYREGGGVGRRADPPAALSDVSLTIAPGERVGLVGPSGAGKSTLTALLLRLYDVDAGRVMVGGRDVRDWPQDALRAQIAVIAQESALFNRSALENIRYGRPDAADHEVERAAEAASAHDFIQDLRDGGGREGYEARLGERGVRLSGGQRQRIALARVILKGAPVLVFDEATSALDSEIEARILSALEPEMAGRTVLAVAHRLSTLQAMDRIVALDAGRIVEQGSHAALLAQGGLYARLWVRQSGHAGALGGAPSRGAAE